MQASDYMNKMIEPMKQLWILLLFLVFSSTYQHTQAQVDPSINTLSQFLTGYKAKLVTSEGTIEIRLNAEVAPIHVLAFIARAEGGFYNNTYFHRVIPGFMIQGGDPNTRNDNPYDDGLGGPMGAIPHEFNTISHKRGIVSMARVSDKRQGAGSQFFIMHADYPSLDNEYTVFGEVISGMEVVDKIATGETHQNDPRLRDRPVKPVYIQSIEITR